MQNPQEDPKQTKNLEIEEEQEQTPKPKKQQSNTQKPLTNSP
jgi:hypothetical protein